MMWVQRQDSFKQKFGDINTNDAEKWLSFIFQIFKSNFFFFLENTCETDNKFKIFLCKEKDPFLILLNIVKV